MLAFSSVAGLAAKLRQIGCYLKESTLIFAYKCQAFYEKSIAADAAHPHPPGVWNISSSACVKAARVSKPIAVRAERFSVSKAGHSSLSMGYSHR